ncbi:hypothetical protein KBD75_04950 [Candidatus Woesebacteria bacterium]|nr:hypothetical protein [Candidatus Woesebacteria bacterium]
MKKILALIVFSFLFAPTASAREGLVDLTSNSVSCKGISIYQDGYYRVTGRCDGLTYPYETTYNKYVLWGKTTARGEMIRIAEIDKGYFSGNIASPFEAMYVTAEKNGLVRKAGDKHVLAGKVTAFSFDKSQVTTAPATTTTTTTPVTSTTTKDTTTTSSTAGAVVGKIVTSLLVVILVIVGLAIGASLLFRSRGSVSH